MKIWLDDHVAPPLGQGWVWVRCVNDAQELIVELSGISDSGTSGSALDLADISLDHDMGENAEFGGSGYDLVKWMEEKGLWPHDPPTVHSWNGGGRKQMEGAIRRYYGRIRRRSSSGDVITIP